MWYVISSCGPLKVAISSRSRTAKTYVVQDSGRWSCIMVHTGGSK